MRKFIKHYDQDLHVWREINNFQHYLQILILSKPEEF